MRDGQLHHAALSQPVAAPAALATGASRVTMGVRPEHLGVTGDSGPVQVELTEALGGVSYVHVRDANGVRLIIEERGDERSAEGRQTALTFEPHRAYFFDADSGARIR